MLDFFYHHFKDWLHAHGMGFFRVFDYVSFRAILAILFSFVFVVLFAKPVIAWLTKQKIGDSPEFGHPALNAITQDKGSTPTMGGLLISSSIFLSTVLLADMTSFYVHMAMICLVWLSILGGFDDWLKLTSARRRPDSRQGLKFWEKMVFQIGLAVLLGVFIYHHGNTKFTLTDSFVQQMSQSLNLPFTKSWVFDAVQGRYLANVMTLSQWVFILFGVAVMVGSSNAVNLTDGMDGLASGVVGICAFAFMVLAYIAGNESIAKFLLVPHIPLSDELAVVAAAMLGSCLGFLWFNCAPAQVFMGDTGSLPLGGLLGYIAVVTRQEFLLFIIGGIFVLEAFSVILQVSYFKFTGGKRIFQCAPIHHHFHLSGWTQQQVVIRFWLLSAMFAAVALATLKLR